MRVTALVLAVLTLSLGLEAQTPNANVDAWPAAVEGHHPGEWDDAVEQVARWSRRDLDEALAAWRRSPANREADASTRFLLRAATLHADIAVFHKTESGYALPSNGEAVMMASDGRPLSDRGGTVHWAFGRRVIDALDGGSARGGSVQLWYRATAAYLVTASDLAEAEAHLARGRALFPDDAVLTFYTAVVFETYADPGIQRVLATLPPSASHSTDPAREWQRAEALFRRALALDPSMTEARMRLAQVVGSLNRHREAVDLLVDARGRRQSPALSFLTHLLLGRELRALDRPADALASYEQAMALYPGASSARFGASQLTLMRGDASSARSLLQVLETRSNAAERDDPWWRYSILHDPSADEWLTAMRRATPR